MAEFNLFEMETLRASASLYDPCVYNPDCIPPWWGF